MYIRHSYRVFWVNQLALFDNDSSAGNGRLKTVSIEFFEVHVFFF